MSTKRAQNERDPERPVRSVRRARRLVSGIVALFVIALLWAFVLPPSVGGRTTLVVTRGISMQPLLQQNDLAILRKRSTYQVGDVVGYHSPSLNIRTLHRIVSINNGVVTTKGDNNTWLDNDHPTFAQIDGELVRHYDGAGKMMLPLHAGGAQAIGAVLIAVAIGFAVRAEVRKRTSNAVGSETSSDRPRRLDRSAASGPRVSHMPTGALGAGLLAGGTLLVAVSLFSGLVAFTSPVKKEPGSVLYNLKGSFGYSAHATGDGSDIIYADGQVSTGDPIYLKLVDQLLLSFDLTLESTTKYTGGGSLGMKMDVVGQSGWSHTISLVEPVHFQSANQRIGTVVSLKELTDLAKNVQNMTKVQDKTITIAFRPSVTMNGELGGTPFKKDFLPKFELTGNDLQLKPVVGSATAEANAPQPKGTAAAPEGVMTGLKPAMGDTFQLAGGDPTHWGPISISLLRVLAVLGLLAGASMTAGFFYLRRKASVEDVAEGRHAAHKFRHLIVPITGIAQAGTMATVVEVPTLVDLAKIAETNDTLMLHELTEETESYHVNFGGTTYRFSHKTRSETTTRARFGVKADDLDMSR